MSKEEVTAYLLNSLSSNYSKSMDYFYEIFNILKKDYKYNKSFQFDDRKHFKEYLENSSLILNGEIVDKALGDLDDYFKFFKYEDWELNNDYILNFSDWFKLKATSFGGIRSIGKYDFNVIFLNRIHKYLVGTWNNFKYNSVLTLFLTYLTEKKNLTIEEHKPILEGKSSNELMPFQDKFISYFKEDIGIDPGVKWGGSINKFRNLINFLLNVKIITYVNGKLKIFGDPYFNEKLIKFILNNLKSYDGENIYSIKNFLKFFDRNIFCLRKKNPIPECIGNLLLSFNNSKFELRPQIGEQEEFLFPNEKKYAFIKLNKKYRDL